ncbi:hypothetical protein [Natrarchaeobius chitinivorans]|nr:hypothetical protein [Natrarchaeobius chitinivorans]
MSFRPRHYRWVNIFAVSVWDRHYRSVGVPAVPYSSLPETAG